MAQLNDIECYKGEAVTLNFTMTPNPSNGIAGWTIVFTLKLSPTQSATLLSINATITDPVNGLFSIALTKAQTNRIAQVYQYDVQRVDAGSEAVLSIGSFTILQEVRNA